MAKLNEIAIGFANRAQRDSRALLWAKLALINSLVFVVIAALPQIQSVELALLALTVFIIGLNQIERAGFIALLEKRDRRHDRTDAMR
jgi:hypothetical protein